MVTIIQESVKQKLSSNAVMCDYETALCNTLAFAFPSAKLFEDAFHLFYNCRKYTTSSK